MKIAIVSYFAPPQPAVASHRVLRMSRALLAAGHQVHWVTLDPELLVKVDDTLAALIPAEVTVHGIGGVNLCDLDAARSFPEKVLRTLAYKAPTWFAVPDRNIEWTWRLKRDLNRCVEREQFDAVLVCCGPHGQILAIPKLRKQFPELDIFVDYRDLLTGNPWHKKPPRIHRKLRATERRILAQADGMFVNTIDAKRQFEREVGTIDGLDISVMRNTADYDLATRIDETIPAVELGAGRHLGFFGTIFQTRRLRPVLDAMARLDGAELDSLTLHAFCDPTVSKTLLAEDAAAAGEHVVPRVQRSNYVRYGQALRTMQAMDALILINSPDEADRVFVPGKLYDYLMAQRPVVFVGCEGDAWRIVAETNGAEWCFRYDETERLAECLRELCQQDRLPDVPRCAAHEPQRSFAPLLDRLAAGRDESSRVQPVR